VAALVSSLLSRHTSLCGDGLAVAKVPLARRSVSFTTLTTLSTTDLAGYSGLEKKMPYTGSILREGQVCESEGLW